LKEESQFAGCSLSTLG